jgi:hypothetical protein
MNRKKGTSERTSRPQRDSPVITAYREFVPAPALTGVGRAYFSFAPNVLHRGRRPITREVLLVRDEPFDMPMLAGTAASLVLDLGATCRVGQGWTVGGPVGARAIGALRSARTPAVNFRPEMIGVYLEPGAAFSLLDIPTVELTDRIVSLEDVWGRGGAQLPAQIAELEGAAQVDRLEAALLEHCGRPGPPPGALTCWVWPAGRSRSRRR